jgi:hypothetical protein
MPSGDPHHAFHGLAHFLEAGDVDAALVQEARAPLSPALPVDQPFVYDGPVGSFGRDAGFLLHGPNIARSRKCCPYGSGVVLGTARGVPRT